MTHPAEQSIGGLEPAAAPRATVQGRALPVGAERLVFYGLLMVSLILVLVFEHLPTEDGPLHVANAAVFLHSEEPVFDEHYEFDLVLVPNMLADLGLAAMLTVMSPALALKLVGFLLAAGFPLAVRWWLGALNPQMVWLATLSIPLAQGRLFYFGFLNFSLGVVLVVLTAGFWLHFIRGRSGGKLRWVGLTLLIALVYLSHPMPFLALLLILGASVLDDALRAREERGAFWSALVRGLAPVLAVSAVPMVLLILFAGGQESSIGYSTSLVDRVLALPVYVVAGLSEYEIPFAALSSLSIAFVAVMTLRKGGVPMRKSPAFLIATGLLIVIYLLVPDTIGEGSVILPRVALFATTLGLFWLARRSVPSWARLAALVATAVVVLGLAVVRLPFHAQLSENISEYLSGEVVLDPGSTVVPLWMTEAVARGPGDGRPFVLPLIELAGTFMASGDVVDLHHLPGSLDIFPFRFSPGFDIRATAEEGGDYPFQFGPGMVDIERFEEQGGARVDFIWLWGRSEADPALLGSERSQRVLALLETEFDLVFTSEGGLLEVYARRPLG